MGEFSFLTGTTRRGNSYAGIFYFDAEYIVNSLKYSVAEHLRNARKCLTILPTSRLKNNIAKIWQFLPYFSLQSGR
jgi:hypothetical protein